MLNESGLLDPDLNELELSLNHTPHCSSSARLTKVAKELVSVLVGFNRVGPNSRAIQFGYCSICIQLLSMLMFSVFDDDVFLVMVG